MPLWLCAAVRGVGYHHWHHRLNLIRPAELERLLGHPLDWSQLEPQRQAHERLFDRPAAAPARRRANPARCPPPGAQAGTGLQLILRVGRRAPRQRGLRAYFDVVRTADDVRLTKPDPELYLAVLSELGVPPAQAARPGRFAQRHPGCQGRRHVLRGGAQSHDQPAPLHEADLRLASLAEMPLQMLLEKLEKLPHKKQRLKSLLQ